MTEKTIVTLVQEEPGPLPDHHKQWFQQMLKAAKAGHLALLSCLDAKTSEPRSVICMMSWDGHEYLMTPIGHLCTEDNPYEAYGPPNPTATVKTVPDCPYCNDLSPDECRYC